MELTIITSPETINCFDHIVDYLPIDDVYNLMVVNNDLYEYIKFELDHKLKERRLKLRDYFYLCTRERHIAKELMYKHNKNYSKYPRGHFQRIKEKRYYNSLDIVLRATKDYTGRKSLDYIYDNLNKKVVHEFNGSEYPNLAWSRIFTDPDALALSLLACTDDIESKKYTHNNSDDRYAIFNLGRSQRVFAVFNRLKIRLDINRINVSTADGLFEWLLRSSEIPSVRVSGQKYYWYQKHHMRKIIKHNLTFDLKNVDIVTGDCYEYIVWRYLYLSAVNDREDVFREVLKTFDINAGNIEDLRTYSDDQLGPTEISDKYLDILRKHNSDMYDLIIGYRTPGARYLHIKHANHSMRPYVYKNMEGARAAVAAGYVLSDYDMRVYRIRGFMSSEVFMFLKMAYRGK